MLEVELQKRVLRLTLNRPERRNALNLELCRALVDAFDRAGADPSIGAVLLRANGTVFSSGMDLTEATGVDHAELARIHERLFTTIDRIPKPIVAAVQGAAIAGGTGLVANAHVVFAGPQATFGLPEIRVGLWPILVYRAVALAVGERRTMAWSLTGRHIQLEEAYQAGLVTNLSNNPVEEAEAEAEDLASRSPAAIAAGFQYVHESRGRTWSELSQTAARIRDTLMNGPDFAEGVKAFREKRAPEWPSLRPRG